MEQHQLTVIGAGPGGYTAALRAAGLGLRVLLVEKSIWGHLLESWLYPDQEFVAQRLFVSPAQRAAAYGFSTGEVGFDFARIQARKAKVVEDLVSNLSGLLKSKGGGLAR